MSDGFVVTSKNAETPGKRQGPGASACELLVSLTATPKPRNVSTAAVVNAKYPSPVAVGPLPLIAPA